MSKMKTSLDRIPVWRSNQQAAAAHVSPDRDVSRPGVPLDPKVGQVCQGAEREVDL